MELSGVREGRRLQQRHNNRKFEYGKKKDSTTEKSGAGSGL